MLGSESLRVLGCLVGFRVAELECQALRKGLTPRKSHGMRLTRPDDELSQGRKGSEWLGQHNGEIGLQDFVFLLSYRKAAGLNFCASCDFRATHPKPLPGLLSP